MPISSAISKFGSARPRQCATDACEAPFGVGQAEIALLDHRGRITAVNGAWRAGFVMRGRRGRSDAVVGSDYVDACKAELEGLDEFSFRSRLQDVFDGRAAYFEATFKVKDASCDSTLRQVWIAPLGFGETPSFVAIHEELSDIAQIRAALHETSEQLLHAQEEERQRIAVELHDSMNEYLVGLIMGLAELRRSLGDDPGVRARVEEMAKMAREAIHETRALSFLMNASAAREDLEGSVRRLVEGFGRRTGLEATFRAQGPLDLVGAKERHALFRVIQEALTNVHRHAHATKVTVSLVSRGGRLTARISDDGRGIHLPQKMDAAAPALGVGVPGMRARIEQLGGRLGIATGDHGVVVSATLPLSQSATGIPERPTPRKRAGSMRVSSDAAEARTGS